MNTLPVELAEHPFLRTLSPRHLEIAAEGSEEATFKPGQMIFREGELANRFYLIQQGQVALEAHSPDRGNILIHNVGAGEVLGWSWLFAPFIWHFRARALEHTKVIALDAGHLLVTSEENHDFGYDLMKRVGQIVMERLQVTRRHLLLARPHRTVLPSELTDPELPKAQSLETAITEHPFVLGINAAQAKALTAQAMQVRFDTGELIFKTGDPANRFYLIQHGRVALESSSADGPVLIQIIGDGDVLGWSWLFEPYVWHFNARALQPTWAIFFYGTRLRELCESDHDLGYELMKRITQVVIQRLQATREGLLAAM